MKIKIDIRIKVGRVVKYFVLVDLLLIFGWGFVEPVFSVFVVRNIQGATLATVGIAAAIYWLLRALLQIPMARFLDKTPGEKDDFYALIIGLFVASFSAFAFALVREVWQLYAVQVLHSIAIALYVTSWSAIFSRHLDKDRVAFDWSLDSTAISLSMGVSSLLGGVVAAHFGFTAVFVAASLFSMVAALVLLAAPELVLPPRTTSGPPVIRDHTPTSLGQ